MTFTLRQILRVPMRVDQTLHTDEPYDNPLCPGLTGPAVFDFGELESFDDGTNVDSPCQFTYDPADYPGLTSIRMIGSLVIEDVVYETLPVISIVDEDGTVYWTSALDWPDYTANPDDTYFYQARFDEVVTLATDVKHTYHIRWSKVSSWNGGFELSASQLWIFFTASDQAKFQIPLMRSLFLDGLGLYLDSNAVGTLNVYAAIHGQTNGGMFNNGAGSFSEVDYREIYLVASKYTGAGTVALRDLTAGAIVSGTEVAIAQGDGVNDVAYSLQFSESLLTAAHDYALWGKHANDNDPVFHTFSRLRFVAGDLNVKVGSPPTGYFTSPDLCAETAEVYVRGNVPDCETVYLNRTYFHHSSDWPASALFYFDATDTANFYISMLDTGTLASPDTIPCAIVTSFLMPGSPALSRQRSGAVTLSDAHLYTSGRNGFAPSGTPRTDMMTFVIGAISGP